MGQEKLRSNLDMIDRQLSELQTVCSSLADEQGRLEKTLHSLESAGEEVDPDEVCEQHKPLNITSHHFGLGFWSDPPPSSFDQKNLP